MSTALDMLKQPHNHTDLSRQASGVSVASKLNMEESVEHDTGVIKSKYVKRVSYWKNFLI